MELRDNLSDSSYFLPDAGGGDYLGGTPRSCILCSIQTQLIGFDLNALVGLVDEVRELRNVISEVTSVDPEFVLSDDESHTTFCCPSCTTKLRVLKEMFQLTSKLQYKLNCMSTAIAYQLLKKHMGQSFQNGSGVNAPRSNGVEIEFDVQFHEWNDKRLENPIIQSHYDSDELLDAGRQMLAELQDEENNCNQASDILNRNVSSGTDMFSRGSEVGFINISNNDDQYGFGQAAVPEQLSAENVRAHTQIPTFTYSENANDIVEADDDPKEGSDGLHATNIHIVHRPFEANHRRRAPNKKFSCDQCPRVWDTQKGLDAHVGKKHQVAAKSYYSCSKCDKVFSQSRSLVYHMGTVHGQQERKKGHHLECPLCNRVVSKRQYLLDHLQKHRKDFPKNQLPCSTCHRNFVTPEFLLAHLPTHRGKHACTKPGCLKILKKFPSSFILMEHMQVHERTSTIFSCDFCYRSFVTESELEIHLTVKHEALFTQSAGQPSKV